MIHLCDATIFNVGADCLVNPINCEGFMAKGISLDFALRYPDLEEMYKQECEEKKILPGHVYLYTIGKQKILNFTIKQYFLFVTRYDWIEQGLKEFTENYHKYNIKSVAFPLLQQHNGELNEDKLLNLMYKYLSNVELDIYICKGSALGGRELIMLQSLQETKLASLKEKLKLTMDTVKILKQNVSRLKRFSDLAKPTKLTPAEYRKVYQYFYNQRKTKYIQLSLFDDAN